MHKRVWIVAVVMMAGLGWSAPAAGQDAPSRGSGAYAGLSAERYVDRLRDMGMLELAEAYVAGLAEQGWEPRRVRRLLADLEVDKARLTDDETRKAHHLTKAAELYRGVVEELDPKNYIELTEKYEVQFKLLSTIVDLHARIYVGRLKVLRGSQADIDELLALIDETIYDLEDLVADVKDALDRINAAGAVPMSEYVIVSPRLESLLREADYTLAWAYLHHARANSPTDDSGTSDRMMMLRDAISLVRQFAEDDASSVQWQSALLMGISLREQGLYDEALAELSALGGNNRAGEMTRVEAMFESSRAQAEQGKLAEAITKAKVYFDESLKLLGDDEGTKNWLSLNAAMLRYHAHMQAAELAGSDDQRQTHQQDAQQELIDFGKEFISVRLSIYAVLAEMYRDRTDYENIPSLFLLAKGTTDEREGTDEGDKQTEEALNVLLERSDPISTQLHAEARAVLARTPEEEETPEEAVRLLELAGGDMSHEQALWWVYSAVDIYDKLITRQYEVGGEASITADQRRTFIDAIRLLLSRDDWLKAEPGLAVYYFELGWHTAQLAGETDDPDEELALYNQAIADYESMPATFGERDNTYRHMYSQTMALELRTFLLLRDMQAARSDEGQETARALRTMLRNYANQARRTIDGMGESDQRSDIIRWGSQADLRAAELTNDPLDNAPAASLELSQLPGKWPEAQDMLQRSAECEIRILRDRGLISQAIEKLNDFLEAHPDGGEALITLIVADIRSNITSLRYDPQRQQALREMQEDYFKLAGDLFSQVADLPIADRYLQTQIYAESHVEIDLPEEARALFQECKDYRQEVGEKLLAELKREYTRKKDDLARVELIKDVAKKRVALQELKDAFLATLETEGIVLASTVESLNAAWAEAAAVGDKSAREQGEDLADVARYLRQGYRRFYERGAPIDPVNDYGLARCMSALGHYEEAAKIYAELLPGIDRNTHPGLYWSIQLERVRSSLMAYQDDPDRLGDLQGLIKKLRVGSNPVFGGPPYRAGFEQLEKQVDDLLEASDSAE